MPSDDGDASGEPDDLNAGSVVRELLEVLEAEMKRLDADLERMYDSWFVETAESGFVPYLGALLDLGLHRRYVIQDTLEVLQRTMRRCPAKLGSRRAGSASRGAGEAPCARVP